MPPRYDRSRRHWQIDAHVTLPSGKTKRLRRRSPINTKAGAAAYEQQAVAELLAAHAAGKAGPAPRFDAFAREYLRKYAAGNNRASTFRGAEQICADHLGPAFGRLPLDEITEEKIEALKVQKLQTHSAQTVKNILSTLRKILSLAVEWRRLSRAPKVHMPKVPPADFDHLSLEETAALVAGARAACPFWAPLLLLAVRTGMRAGELRGLQWGDLDFSRRRLTVKRAVVGDRIQPPKSGKSRRLPLPADILEELQALHKARPKGALWVWSTTGGPVTLSGIGRALERACEEAGVRRIHPHVLRHTYASQLVELGVPLRVVQQLLGHSSITTTERYAHLAPGAEEAAVARLEEATRGTVPGVKTLEHKRNSGSEGEGGQ